MNANEKKRLLQSAVWVQMQVHPAVPYPEPLEETQTPARLAVLFPGTGYSCDRPLLYFARRMAEQAGCDVLPLSYTVSLPRDVPHLSENVCRCLPDALQQAAAAVTAALSRRTYTEFYFFSKSFGTVVAGELERVMRVRVNQFFLTPLEPTLPYLQAHPCYASCGTADALVSASVRRQFAAVPGVRLGLFPGANHSLEIPGDAQASVRNLQIVMDSYAEFLREAGRQQPNF